MKADREQDERHGAHSLRAPDREVEHTMPAVDIYETEAAHVVLMDLPGVRRDGLDIHVEQERLMVRGRVDRDEQPKLVHEEFRLRDYYRAFTLADEIDTERITAKLQEGVLRLELPKSARARVRRIQVG